MAEKLTQAQLEAPAKVYQLGRVEDKVDNVIILLNSIQAQTAGLVTNTQLAEMRRELEEKFKSDIEQLRTEFKGLDKRVTVTEDGQRWGLRAIIGAGLGVLAQLTIFVISLRGR